jgi:hypothetical protein
VELEARRRAIEGESDLLLIFLLKAHRPQKYREKVQPEHTGDVTARVIYDGDPDPAPPGATCRTLQDPLSWRGFFPTANPLLRNGSTGSTETVK